MKLVTRPELLLKRMTALNWDHAKLSRNTGVCEARLKLLLAGRRVPTLGEALRLTGAVGLQVEDVFGLEKE